MVDAIKDVTEQAVEEVKFRSELDLRILRFKRKVRLLQVKHRRQQEAVRRATRKRAVLKVAARLHDQKGSRQWI